MTPNRVLEIARQTLAEIASSKTVKNDEGARTDSLRIAAAEILLIHVKDGE